MKYVSENKKLNILSKMQILTHNKGGRGKNIISVDYTKGNEGKGGEEEEMGLGKTVECQR